MFNLLVRNLFVVVPHETYPWHTSWEEKHESRAHQKHRWIACKSSTELPKILESVESRNAPTCKARATWRTESCRGGWAEAAWCRPAVALSGRPPSSRTWTARAAEILRSLWWPCPPGTRSGASRRWIWARVAGGKIGSGGRRGATPRSIRDCRVRCRAGTRSIHRLPGRAGSSASCPRPRSKQCRNLWNLQGERVVSEG